MASAKQIAARKKFAEMARSGALAKKRKTAAKKNPAKRPAKKVAAVEKNPVAPRKSSANARFMNPKDSFDFKVYKADSNDKPSGAPVGAFKSRSVAVAFANAYAKMADCSVVLVKS